MSAPDKLNLLYVSTNVLNKDKSSSGNSADFFLLLSKAILFLRQHGSRKKLQRKDDHKKFFPPKILGHTRTFRDWTSCIPLTCFKTLMFIFRSVKLQSSSRINLC